MSIELSFDSDRLFERSHGEGGGGGVAPGADGAGKLGNSGVGATARWGAIVGGGVNSGVVFNL